MGHPVREQFLAALLRFADELADDRLRASGFLLKLALLKPGSEVYHRYAQALHSVVVDAQSGAVDLRFDMTVEDACRQFGKGDVAVYLLDEIFDRTLKMDRERKYCMRFLRPLIDSARIDVEITVYGPSYQKKLAQIPYRLEESGYPEAHPGGILMACPTLNDLKYGAPLNGQALRNYLAEAQHEQ